MPSRNIIRNDSGGLFYHVYLRGISKGLIFNSSRDKDYFLYLIARYISKEPSISKESYKYPHYRDQIELLTYCLMDNHFHLLFFQFNKGSVSQFMKSLVGSYTAYFNRHYGRTGPLFESRFKAVSIDNDAYLLHISRYIHMNPRSWKRYFYSSFHHIENNTEPEWLQTQRIVDLFVDRKAYTQFVRDYENRKKELDAAKR